MLKKLYRLGTVHHSGILWQPQLCMETPNDIESKCVEGAYPHGCGCRLVLTGNAVCHFTSSLVGKRQQKNATRINAVFEQTFDTRGQCLCFTSAWPCFQQIGFTTMCRSFCLQRIGLTFSRIAFNNRCNSRQ